MASDDMHVVAYKVLAYLYACMRAGQEPDADGWSAAACGVPYAYWVAVLRELCEHGYVRGVVIAGDADACAVVKGPQARVTLEGVEFMQENSRMKRAMRTLREAKAAVPGL